MQINQLSTVDAVSAGDLAVIFSQQNGDARAAAMSVLLEYFQSQLTAGGDLITQYSAPNATAFSATIAPPVDGANMHLLLTPTAAFAAGTVILPALPVDGQQIVVTTTQTITALTVNGNGSTVNGAPTTLAANGFFRLKYDGVFRAWFRIG